MAVESLKLTCGPVGGKGLGMRIKVLSLLVVLATACAPTYKVSEASYTPQQAIPVQPSADPVLDKAQSAQQAADTAAAVTASKVKLLSSNLASTSAQLNDSINEVDRLQKQGSATKAELMALYNHLVDREKELAAMVAANKATETDLESERAIRIGVSADLVAAHNLIAASDTEKAQLRNNLANAETQAAENKKISDTNASAARNAQVAEAAAVSAEKIASGQRTKLLVAAIVEALAIIALAYLLLKP